MQAGNDARTGRALLEKIAESIETLGTEGIESDSDGLRATKEW
jgi:hypothetical protein